jgi:hypothetical protein
MKNEFLETENYFNEELIELGALEDDFEPIIELKPKKPKMKYKFYIAS